ncbi:MAG: heme lyase CcmF/NrfE family subunit [Chloroflexi bacterium CFX4]|nr:heme lyase CcmF/NrfE family subunit [Chloroflexi bacterium CFX4]MDL1922439.1 heme lyase CcmF/NrfE family subunit [Chloroflexi bacterium CFX3]
MLAELGFIATFLAFLAALYAAGMAFYGVRRRDDRLLLSARNAALATFPLMSVSLGALLIALVTQQYQIAYVWNVTDPNTPTFFRITALWGAQAGSLLFWSGIMSAFAFGTIALNWHGQRRLMPYVITYIMLTLAFFLGLSLFLENPFERYWIMPDNSVVKSVFALSGAVPPAAARLAETSHGLNPLLRHFGMIVHPPLLYMGFVGFIIPFAFAMAALASGDLSTGWIKATRRWTLLAWVSLSLGLVLGGRWAYDVLGWGGWWGWDPVENAAFLPWLLGTAFLHSVMIQEKRGMLKVWNMFLMLGTFSAVIFGTFATRSGLVDSVHSFARSGIGFPLFFFWFSVTAVSVGMLLWRWRRGELRDDRRFNGLLSRESLFVLNNIVFVMLFIAIFWGSFGAPIVSELFLGTNITLGKDYFLQVTPPLFLALFILMGVAPLSAWGVTSLLRLGKALIVPALLAAAMVALLALMQPAEPLVLLIYGVIALSGTVALWETYRGAAARHKTLGENWATAVTALVARNRRRYGGYLIHLSIAIVGIGALGSELYQQETQRTLAVGQSLALGGYTMRYDGFLGGQIADDGRVMDIAQVTVIRDGREIAHLRPRRDFYPNAEGMNTMTIPAAHSTAENDFYVLLVDWEAISASSATFKVFINPLINLIWWGSLLLVFGTLVGMYPDEKHALATAVAAQPSRLAGVKA